MSIQMTVWYVKQVEAISLCDMMTAARQRELKPRSTFHKVQRAGYWNLKVEKEN